MIEKNIDHIRYRLDSNKKSNQPGAIVFIGAGCSISAGIPSADKIVDYVLENFKGNPDIKDFDKRPTYAELMQCLGPKERNKIFRHYVEDAKINVSHIYLAHLMALGYVDYIITVNFDNLAQKALALYNIFPPTYDISILKDLTTTSLDTKSITYLHGQYNGLWQLNTKEEMNKVIDSNVAKSIFDKIANNRLWILVGYSGDDFIFDQLIKLGRFDNGLYWVGYKGDEPTPRVQTGLLNKPNTESFWVKGYDADSFFLKLNAILKNDEPKIFNTPFSFLSELQEGIRDIDDSEEYKSVKERFIESKKMVLDSINRYEKAESDVPQMTNTEIDNNQLKKALIDCLINNKYDELKDLEDQVRRKQYVNLLSNVADIYYNWGTYLGDLAKTKSGDEAEKLYLQAFEKLKKAIEIDPNYRDAYYNWGTYLGYRAKTKPGDEAEILYLQAFEKYNKAIEIKPDYPEAYFSWGTYLANLAQLKPNNEAEKLYLQAFEKLKKATEIKPDYPDAYYNWGNDLANLAKLKSGDEAEKLYLQAFEKLKTATEIKPDYHSAYYNWGVYLANLAQLKPNNEAEKLYLQAFEKLKTATEIKPDYQDAYYNWGIYLANMAQLKPNNEAEIFYLQAFEKLKKATEIKPDYEKAYYNWGTYIANLAQLKSGDEVEKLYLQAFEKYEKAIEIKPDYQNAYYGWGYYLEKLANLKSGDEAKMLQIKSSEKLNIAAKLSGKS